MNNTTGRLLALNLAATEHRDDMQQLIQAHLDHFPRDEAVHVLAVALGTLAADVLAPAVNQMTEAGEWREMHREGARRIVAGPNTEREQ